MIEGYVSIHYIYENRAAEDAYEQIRASDKYVEYADLTVDDAEAMEDWFSYDNSAVTHTIDYRHPVSEGLELLDTLVSFIREVYQLTAPTYVCSVTQAEYDAIGVEEAEWGIESPIDAEALAAHRVAQPTWLMLLPPAMVETYGREWLHDLPAARIEDLDDGAVLIVGAEEFGDCESGIEVGQRIEDPRLAFEEAFAERTV